MPAETEQVRAVGGEVGDQLTFLSIIASLSSPSISRKEPRPAMPCEPALIVIRIGEELGLSRVQLSDLYYALLLKDAGCSLNASRLHHCRRR